MTNLKIQIADTTVYEGPASAVPRVGDAIRHDGEALPIEAVVWDFAGTEGAVSVVLMVGTRPYTF